MSQEIKNEETKEVEVTPVEVKYKTGTDGQLHGYIDKADQKTAEGDGKTAVVGRILLPEDPEAALSGHKNIAYGGLIVTITNWSDKSYRQELNSLMDNLPDLQLKADGHPPILVGATGAFAGSETMKGLVLTIESAAKPVKGVVYKITPYANANSSATWVLGKNVTITYK